MATDNVPIDYQYTIIALTKFWYKIGKNKYFILHWQNSGNRNNALVSNGKSLVKSNICKLWPAKIFKCIGKRLAVIGNQYFASRYQYIINFVREVFIIKVAVTESSFKWNLQRDKSLQCWILRKRLF